MFAERAAALRSDGTQATTVITREEIERRGAADAIDLLREVAGLHVDRLGASGPANVYIRGAEPNHTVVLVDGVRLNDPADPRGGSFDLGAISLHEVERIEVLRGASSAQFGADAMGGVINIVTRRSGVSTLEAGVGAGTRGYRDLHARATVRAAGVLTLGASRREDGREDQGGESRRDAVDASWSLARAGRELRANARAGRSDASAFPESSGGVRLAGLRLLERREVDEGLASISWSEDAAPWRWSLRAAASRREEGRVTPPVLPGPGGFVPAADSRTDLRRTGAAAHLAYSRGWLEPSLGLEAWREDGKREGALFVPDPLPARYHLVRDTRSAFAQLTAAPWQQFEMLAAVRRDDVDPGGRETTTSAGLRWRLPEGHALRAHWSEGFKPPSFFALGDPLVGNPELQPERSRNAELGWDAGLGELRLQATLFRNRYRNLVDFDAETFRMVNRAGARTRGGELQVRQRLAEAWRVEGSYTHAKAELIDADAPLRNRPRHRGSLALGHERGGWSARAAVVRVGRSFDFSVPTGAVEVPGFTTLDLAARWRTGHLDVGLAVDNATDRRYESFIGFTAPGRRLRAFASSRW